jgi:indole-3-glycerol phosphate synthase
MNTILTLLITNRYEDLETLRESPTGKVLPVIANDFVLYAYQLFRAKSSGADAIKLHASILPPTEISYMAKIARKINLGVVVVVSTMPQLMAVLGSVPELNTLSISNRNMRLWKISPGKALRILSDPGVRAVLTTRRLAGAGTDGGGINVMLEGLSTPEEMVAAREDPLVDGVFLAEELVPSRLSVAEAVQSLL